jgi:signal transduction histidine kinase
MKRVDLATFVRRLGGFLLPLVVLTLIVISLRVPIVAWLHGNEIYDEEAIREWIREARIESIGLPELVRSYLDMATREQQLKDALDKASESDRFDLSVTLDGQRQKLEDKREEIHEFFKALCNPTTKLYRGQLPLFVVVYRVSLRFAAPRRLTPIDWDSELPREASQFRELNGEAMSHDAWVDIEYGLHAYHQVQTKERQEAFRRLLLGGLGILGTLLGAVWFYLFQRRQRRQEHQRLLAEQQASAAERRRLEEELRRQEAERKHEEAERQNLELKSQLFANIGIMAGSYAHNIKNLLVRPNDLLRRCLEEGPDGDDQSRMLREVKDTLGTVTERLQQILQTVRRDPNRSEMVQLDLNALVADMHRVWGDLAREKWKMNLALELAPETAGPLLIDGDLSHLQQAFENLLFNARDATFEMRNHLRELARKETQSDNDKRQALLAATSWRGAVVLRTRREADHAVLEVSDNGIGMTTEVRERCTQTHFSTKRNNALFAGLSAGMGLGLSFVTVILAHHRATLVIESEPLHGATFRIRFPLTVQHPV